MTRKVIIRREAEAEVQAAFDWYEEQSDGLGFEFLRAIDACVSGVQRNPFAFTVVHEPDVRRALVRRFPYALFYLANDEAIIVIAVFNVRRHPIDWLRRV